MWVVYATILTSSEADHILLGVQEDECSYWRGEEAAQGGLQEDRAVPAGVFIWREVCMLANSTGVSVVPVLH